MALRAFWILSFLIFYISCQAQSKFDSTSLSLRKVIAGKITPKSVVYGGNGKFFAQNMMYSHTITVYNSKGSLLKTIIDTVSLEAYGFADHQGKCSGAPVEACKTPDNKWMWISNYEMEGTGFDKPGCDRCSDTIYDHSFLYGINTATLKVEKVVQTGSVPKFVAVSGNGKYLAVSNWSSRDVSLYKLDSLKHVTSIKVGKYPRGLAFDESNTHLYVGLMGDDKIASIDLTNLKVRYYENVGDGPRHLLIHNGCLYYSLNSGAKVVKWNFRTDVKSSAKVGTGPRSMAFSADYAYLYVVNYHDDTFSKIRTSDMEVVQTLATRDKPIGITVDPENNRVWVACYSGNIMLFDEQKTEAIKEFQVIVSSYAIEKEARLKVQRLIDQGYRARLVARNNRYRVAVFQSNNLVEARSAVKKFRHLHPDTWVLKIK